MSMCWQSSENHNSTIAELSSLCHAATQDTEEAASVCDTDFDPARIAVLQNLPTYCVRAFRCNACVHGA